MFQPVPAERSSRKLFEKLQSELAEPFPEAAGFPSLEVGGIATPRFPIGSEPPGSHPESG